MHKLILTPMQTNTPTSIEKLLAVLPRNLLDLINLYRLSIQYITHMLFVHQDIFMTFSLMYKVV